jgi:hypothetical protein
MSLMHDFFLTAPQGRRRVAKPTGNGMAPMDPANGDDDDERDPENTRDMLWLYLQAQLKLQKDGTEGIKEGIKTIATSQAAAAVQQSRDRRFEAKIAGGLALLLILIVAALAHIDVTGQYDGAGISLGRHAAQ